MTTNKLSYSSTEALSRAVSAADGDDLKSGEDVRGEVFISRCDAADVLEAIAYPFNGASACGQALARSGPSSGG